MTWYLEHFGFNAHTGILVLFNRQITVERQRYALPPLGNPLRFFSVHLPRPILTFFDHQSVIYGVRPAILIDAFGRLHTRILALGSRGILYDTT